MIRLPGLILAGHGVAGGRPDSPFPAGTIELQAPFFRERGLDLAGFHLATLNVSTAPVRIHVARPVHRFEDLHWTTVHGPETFEFVHVEVEVRERVVAGWGYRPTPETKAAHPHPPEVLEVIVPFLPEVAHTRRVTLGVDPGEVWTEGPESR